MKIVLAVVGRNGNGYLQTGIEDYVRRLSHYVPFSIVYVGDAKNTRNLTQAQQKQAEGQGILAAVGTGDYMVLLDERGKEMTSVDFSQYVQRKMLAVPKTLFFVVGGPYGFSEEVYARANDKVSLSKMTFSHEMIRLIFVEQLYRAMTILRNEPYHHQ